MCFVSSRRLGIAAALPARPPHKNLMHINAKSVHRTDPSFGGLDCASAAIKLAAGFLE
jgi:hypothetical protein